MASAQNFVQNSQTKVVQHNHVVIKYQQPPDLAIINHVLEILVAATRSYAQKNLVQIPYIQDYIDQIILFLQTLYSESAQWVLQQGVPPPVSNTIYLPHTCSDLQHIPTQEQSNTVKCECPGSNILGCLEEHIYCEILDLNTKIMNTLPEAEMFTSEI